MNLFGAIFKRSHIDFFQNLIDHSRMVYEGYRTLARYMKEPGDRAALAEELFQAERAADDLRRILIDRLNRTLITPIDREDLFSLSREIDTVLDAAKSTVEEMRVFQVDPVPELVQMTEIMERGTLELYEAFQNLHKYPGVAREHAINAKRTENHMHHVYLEALAKLFNRSDLPAGYIMKMREIFRHLNRSSDRCDEAANLLLDTLVKLE
ncbi:MAG: DUF47 family protein [Candidatus Aureabacteria bacterium]|nr:DUF47 family protein [Candidatus Auribacterota bacterium]